MQHRTHLAFFGVLLVACGGDGVQVTNDGGGQDVTPPPDAPAEAKTDAPPIVAVQVAPSPVDVAGTATVNCVASDPDGDAITYALTATAGKLLASNAAATTFTAPDTVNPDVEIVCTATDARGKSTKASAHVAIQLPARGLLGHWDFQGNTNDVSGAGRHGTIQGAPTYGVDRFGKPAGAINFATNADKVVVAHEDAFNGVTALTVAAWIQPEAANVSRPIVAKNNGSIAGAYQLEVLSDNFNPTVASRLAYQQTVTNGVYSAMGGPTKLSNATFTHVVMVRDGGTVKFYQNGTETASASVVAPIPNNSPFTIGSGLNVSFRGRIDDVRVYDRVLGPVEIAALAAEK